MVTYCRLFILSVYRIFQIFLGCPFFTKGRLNTLPLIHWTLPKTLVLFLNMWKVRSPGCIWCPSCICVSQRWFFFFSPRTSHTSCTHDFQWVPFISVFKLQKLECGPYTTLVWLKCNLRSIAHKLTQAVLQVVSKFARLSSLTSVKGASTRKWEGGWLQLTQHKCLI